MTLTLAPRTAADDRIRQPEHSIVAAAIGLPEDLLAELVIDRFEFGPSHRATASKKVLDFLERQGFGFRHNLPVLQKVRAYLETY